VLVLTLGYAERRLGVRSNTLVRMEKISQGKLFRLMRLLLGKSRKEWWQGRFSRRHGNVNPLDFDWWRR